MRAAIPFAGTRSRCAELERRKQKRSESKDENSSNKSIAHRSACASRANVSSMLTIGETLAVRILEPGKPRYVSGCCPRPGARL